MNKTIRILIAIVLLSVIVVVADKNVAWAGSLSVSNQAVSPQEQASAALDKPEPGSVKPPPGELTACKDGTFSVGGVAVLSITDLAPGYCVIGFLRNHGPALGRVPDGAGKVLAPVTFLRIFYHGKLVSDLPIADGQVQLCYSLYPDKTVQMYFLDFYGPRFGRPKDQLTWLPVATTVDEVTACTAAQATGAYALIGQ